MPVKVYILARPQFAEGHQAFLRDFLPEKDRNWSESDSATPAERLVEFAGRICYMSFGARQSPATNAEYIQKLIRNQHESVLEHAVWSLLISGVSRAFTHQLVRHRVGFSFSQLSQQYHDESNAKFIKPSGIEQTPELVSLWEQAIRNSQATYREILGALEASADHTHSKRRRELTRMIRSIARSVLPNAMETVIVATVNARALRHFLRVRGNIIGDAEMRCVSAALLETIRPDGPALFSDFRIEHLPDGLPLVIQESTPGP